VLPQGSATCYQSTSTVRLAVGGATRCPFGGRTRGAPASTARGPGWPRRRGGTRGLDLGVEAWGWRYRSARGWPLPPTATAPGSWPARLWAAFCSARV